VNASVGTVVVPLLPLWWCVVCCRLCTARRYGRGFRGPIRSSTHSTLTLAP